jgi:hypothetical protein
MALDASRCVTAEGLSISLVILNCLPDAEEQREAGHMDG